MDWVPVLTARLATGLGDGALLTAGCCIGDVLAGGAVGRAFSGGKDFARFAGSRNSALATGPFVRKSQNTVSIHPMILKPLLFQHCIAV